MHLKFLMNFEGMLLNCGIRLTAFKKLICSSIPHTVYGQLENWKESIWKAFGDIGKMARNGSLNTYSMYYQQTEF